MIAQSASVSPFIIQIDSMIFELFVVIAVVIPSRNGSIRSKTSFINAS